VTSAQESRIDWTPDFTAYYIDKFAKATDNVPSKPGPRFWNIGQLESLAQLSWCMQAYRRILRLAETPLRIREITASYNTKKGGDKTALLLLRGEEELEQRAAANFESGQTEAPPHSAETLDRRGSDSI